MVESSTNLFAFFLEVLDEYFEVLVGVEDCQLVLVLGVDQPQVLVCVRKNVLQKKVIKYIE